MGDHVPLADVDETATGFGNLEWWGYVEFLTPIDQAARDRIERGEPFDLLSPELTVERIFNGERDGRDCYLVIEGEHA